MKKRFYQVNHKGRSGWMSEDQITEPKPKEFSRPALKAKEPNCPPESKSANAVKGLMLQIPELQNAVDKQMALGSPKNNREIDRYMCLYRDGRIKSDNFPNMYKAFQKSVKQASQAFGVPYGLIMCTMLVESGLYYNPQETKEYKGLPQFGSALVVDLNKAKTRNPYNKMWEKFQKINPNAPFTDQAIRSSPNPASPAAAIALAYQWMYWDRLKQSGCKDCSISSKMNRKDLYMLVTGYNWGPYSLHKVAHKTPAQMRGSPPPPKESRDYMARMENCLEGGYDQSFRDEGTKIQKPADRQKRGLSATAQNSVQKPKGHSASERKIYESRVEQCDRLYPVK